MEVTLTPEEVGLTLRNEKLEGILSFLASRSKSSARTLAPTVSEVLNGCAAEIDTILCNVIESRTKAEFRREFERSFPKYLGLTLAMSHFAKAVVLSDARERLTRESICEMEAEFREKAQAAFGTVVRDQALFTVWTLRKINEILPQIIAAKLDPSKKAEDAEHCAMFNVHAFRAQFSLDCLTTALDNERAIYPEVLEELTDALRSMVNAYAHAREGLEVRVPSQEPSVTVPSMDEEDRALVEAAFLETGSLSEEGL